MQIAQKDTLLVSLHDITTYIDNLASQIDTSLRQSRSPCFKTREAVYCVFISWSGSTYLIVGLLSKIERWSSGIFALKPFKMDPKCLSTVPPAFSMFSICSCRTTLYQLFAHTTRKVVTSITAHLIRSLRCVVL